jgi:hypothetical protein
MSVVKKRAAKLLSRNVNTALILEVRATAGFNKH